MSYRSLTFLALLGLVCTAVLVQPIAAVEQRGEHFALGAAAPRGLSRRSHRNTAGLGADFTVLLTSDSHGAAGAEWDFSKMPDADVLIHCGDITDEGRIEEYTKVVPFFMGHKSSKLKIFIAGNHDFTLDKQYFEKNASPGNTPIPNKLRGSPDKVKQEMKDALAIIQSKEAQAAGIKYLTEGMHSLQVFVSPMTPEFHNYAFAYEAKTDKRFNVRGKQHYIPSSPLLKPHFVITHGPPEGILDKTVTGFNAGDPNLWEAMKRVKPLFHAFGHIHEAVGTVRVNWKTGAKSKPVDEHNVIDLTRKGGKDGEATGIKRNEETLFLNVAQRALNNKNPNPWKLLKLKWMGAEKGKHFKDNNDPSKLRNKIKHAIQHTIKSKEKDD